MFKFLMFFLLIGLVLASMVKPVPKSIKQAGEPFNSVKQFILDKGVLWEIIQNWRVENDLPEYTETEFTCNIADTRLKEVLINFSHDGFSAKRFCNSDCGIGENLVQNIGNEAQSLQAWLNSPEHLKNLKANYTHSCLRVYQDTAVHIFSY